MQSRKLKIGTTGLGGWAGWMLDRLLDADSSADPMMELKAVSEPQPERFPQRVERLQRLRIPIVRDFESILAMTIDAVYLPLPIPLHRKYTERALAAGKAVLCEKPAAGSVEDVAAMIAARDRAKLAVAIGFNHVYQPAVWELKRRLCDGEFGNVLKASVLGCWPRGDAYYQRADWVGKLRHEGRWVLDTPVHNAFSHYVHLALFWLGASIAEAARPALVEAETYRVNPIETYDTCSLRTRLKTGVPIVVGLTHACATSIDPEIAIVAERAQIRYRTGGSIEIRRQDAVEELSIAEPMHTLMFHNFRDLVLGGPDASQIGTLEMARAQTQVAQAASSAGDATVIDSEFTRVIEETEGKGKLKIIDGIEDLLRRCIDRGQLLHESRLVSWTQPSRSVSVPD